MTAGMLAPSHEEFVPLQVMKKFPYVHANKDDMKIVSTSTISHVPYTYNIFRSSPATVLFTIHIFAIFFLTISPYNFERLTN